MKFISEPQRTKRGVVDVYTNHTHPYLDVKCDAVLTGPIGPCHYCIKDTATGVTQSYLIDVVAPTIKEECGGAHGPSLGTVPVMGRM
jgi:hypothetical protein